VRRVTTAIRPRAGALYELVGLGMAAYGRAAFRTELIGMDRLRMEPGAVIVAAHLSDQDVPVVAGAIYRGTRMWRGPRVVRPGFAVRNDLLLPGFFAGYPPKLPILARRALYPLGIGRIMRERMRCLPVRFSNRIRLVEALRHDPDVELAAALPAARVEALLRRAESLGRPAPVRARDVLDGRYADLLWEIVDRSELETPALSGMWSGRLVESGSDLRALGEFLRAGGALVVFPHGFPSPDGGIDTLDRRVGRLLHRLAPGTIQPLGLAYDPLVRGRPRAFVSTGAEFGPLPRRGGEREVLAALRAATPLTAGLIVALDAVRRGAAPHLSSAVAAAERAVADANREGRPVEPSLRDVRLAARRIGEAVQAIQVLGATHPLVLRTARTYATSLEEAA
jgi:1-acyl-sn-glycerol-3-phosphate acyltransferase